MPISGNDDCSEDHWRDVRKIIGRAIRRAGFEPNLVSDADDAGVIQKRIIQNLYENPIVVCDVSGRNPNVMFELGMRLAFDKATIIVKDDATPFSFDTAPIEHIEYRRDLRHSDIVEFEKKLRTKISATDRSFQDDPEHTAFLKHFGRFKVAQMQEREVSGQEFIMEELKEVRRLIGTIVWNVNSEKGRFEPAGIDEIDICLVGLPRRSDIVREIVESISGLDAIDSVDTMDFHDHAHVFARLKSPVACNRREVETQVRNLAAFIIADR